VLIESVRAFAIRSDLVGGPARTPARRPHWTAAAEVASPMARFPRFKRLRASWRPAWPSVGCLVTARDGSFGLGMTRYGTPVVAIIEEHLAPLLVGEPATATERLWDLMSRAVSPYAGGLASYALSAVDLALWDLKGKLLGRPVFELLGGPVRERIACYATGNDTDWHLELGFRATKLACPFGPVDGRAGLDANEALVARTRELVGPAVELMLDCWMALDLDFTVRLAERLRPYALGWIEDPLLPDDLEGVAALRRRLPWQTLATGEHWYTPGPFAAAVAGRWVDVLQPDIGWAGGLTGCLKIAHLAEPAGIAVVPHAGMNTAYGQHLALALSNCPMGEYFLASPPGVPLAEVRLTPGTAVPEDGFLTPGDGPGFGLGLDLEGIERLRA
jgi:L-rhamnonate dehydratase